MRVALVCPYAWDRFGGVQSHVRDLAEALRVRGNEVEIFAPATSARLYIAGATIVGRAVPLPANGSVAPIAFGPGSARRIGQELSRFDPDVVHVHEPLVPSLAMLALRASDAPAIGTFHASAPGSLGYRVGSPLLERVAARLSVRTAVSEQAAALARRYFPGEYRIVPNGVDVARFAAAASTQQASERSVLFLGRIERRKGLEVLVQAMTRLRNSNVTLVVAGEGPLRSRCEGLARRLLVRAAWLGAIPEERKPTVFANADVYCAPALGGESFGIVLVEAMAAGTPVVCSDLPGFRAASGDAAAFVPPGEPGPLAGALREVLGDSARATELRDAGRLVADRYDWRRLAEEVEGLYTEAVAGRS